MRLLSLASQIVFLTVFSFGAYLYHPTVAHAALTDGLVSYWTLDEASGTRADAHASNDLTDNNTVLATTGVINNGGDFERSSSEYLSIADASQTGLDITGDISVSAWVKLENFISAEAGYMILSKYNPTGDLRAYRLWMYEVVADEAKIELDWSSDGTTSNLGTEITDNFVIASAATLYHVVATLDVSVPSATIYINGTAVASTNTGESPTSIVNNTAPFQVGARPTTEFFDGLIDEVGIWNRVLTAEEVTSLYNGGAGLAYPLTVASPASSIESDFIIFE